MKKTQGKDAFRNIKKRIVSYLSVCLVIMLGLGGLFITRYMGAGINAEATKYYNDHGFKNYELISSVGISDADIAQIKGTEGVTDAEGVIRTSGALTKGDLNCTVELISMTDRVSAPEVIEGKAPAAKNECLLAEDTAETKGLKVGDKVRIIMTDSSISGDLNDPDNRALFETEFTITGLMKHPDYFRRNSTDTVALPWEAFNRKYLGDLYTHALVKTEEPEGADIFSDKYFKKTADMKERLEELAAQLEVDSLARAKENAYAALDEKWQEALDELEEGQNEIDENEAELNAELANARGDLNSAQNRLNKKVKEANKKINEAEKEIKDNEKKIKDGEEEIQDYRDKLKLADENLPAAKERVKSMRETDEAEIRQGKNQIAYAKSIIKQLKNIGKIVPGDTAAAKLMVEFAALVLGVDPPAIAENETKDGVMKIFAELLSDNEGKVWDLKDFLTSDDMKKAAKEISDVTGKDYTSGIEKIEKFDVMALMYLMYDVAENDGDLNKAIAAAEDYIKTYEDKLKEVEEYESYIKEYEENRDDYYRQLDDKQKELDAAKKKLAKAKKKLAAKKKQLAEEKRKYQAQINAGWNTYYAQKADFEGRLEEAKALLAENREEAEKKFAELRADVENLECKWLVLDRRANAGYVDIRSNVGAISTASLIFGILFMLISAIVCFSTLSIIIEEQKKMVGTVKAFGFHKGEVLGKYLVFGVSAAIIGCIAGILLALGLSGVVLKAYHNSGMYQFARPSSVVTPGVTIIACLIMLAICAVATVVACSDILKSPASILMKGGTAKKKEKKKKEKKNSAESKPGGSLYSKLIIRNMLDDKVRVIISILIIAFSTFLVGTGISMKLAFDGMADKQVNDIYKYDVRVDLGEDTSPEQRGAIEKVMTGDGADYTRASYTSHVLRIGDRIDAVSVLAGDPEKINDYFAIMDTKKGNTLELPADGVLAQKKMKESYDMGEGTTLSVFSDDLHECSADVRGVFQNYVGRLIITSPEGYRSVFGEDAPDNCYLVRLNGADLDKFEKELLAAKDDVSFEVASEFAKKFETASLLYNLIVIVTTGIAILMSFMILSNLANIFLNRKKTELTVMRINGFSIKQTKGYLVRETIITTAVGVLLGVLVGAIGAPLIIKAMEQPDLQFVRNFHVLAWVIAVVLEGIFAIVIYSFVFRKVKKLNFRDVQ